MWQAYGVAPAARPQPARLTRPTGSTAAGWDGDRRAPTLAAELEAGLKRLKLATVRRIAPEILETAETLRAGKSAAHPDRSGDSARPRSPPGPRGQDLRVLRHRRVIDPAGHIELPRRARVGPRRENLSLVRPAGVVLVNEVGFAPLGHRHRCSPPSPAPTNAAPSRSPHTRRSTTRAASSPNTPRHVGARPAAAPRHRHRHPDSYRARDEEVPHDLSPTQSAGEFHVATTGEFHLGIDTRGARCLNKGDTAKSQTDLAKAARQGD
jgi:hypothetical protein